ncbi:MFS transporter [Fulvivirgaceae bacterium PWU5]|uniref:MFS transporter n=2 Tax=Dawidia cretensis TaxID=2782350 RepID=A0AAP2E1K1_9BACT|nr:MFS transporter [Dawidia cretensis]
MIIPELPAYLTELGGADYKGLIISLFALTAMISRPFSGRLADTLGRVPVMVVGSVVCCLCSLVYPVLTSIAGFLLLRLVHGFSTGFTPTGQTAYLSDIIPAHRRGEAMGLLGTAGSVGSAAGPALGGTLANHFGLNVMFYCSSSFAILSIIILIGIRDTVAKKHSFHPRLLKVRREDLFEPRVLTPAIIMALIAYAYGAIFTLLPDLGGQFDVRNKGLLFSYFTVASLLVRLLGGKASDRFGRRAVLRVSATFIAIAMLIIAFADSRYMLIAGVVVYGFAQGITSPTLLAWAADLAHPTHRGRGMASLYISMELGILLGALASGWLYGNEPANTTLTFCVCSAMAAMAWIFINFNHTRKKKP